MKPRRGSFFIILEQKRTDNHSSLSFILLRVQRTRTYLYIDIGVLIDPTQVN